MKLNRFLLLTLLSALVLVMAACGKKELEDTLDWKVGSFQATTQANNSFSTDEMKGKVWIADLIFTSCETVCPPMTRNMSQLQKKFKEEGLDVEFVSFSVDPKVDTPEKLKEFGKSHGASFKNWTYVTGYSQKDIQTFAKDTFHTLAEKIEGTDQVSHGSSFYLINKDNVVMKKYSGTQDVQYEQIIKDAKVLLNEES
ncbi:SCO family protein [Halobacillus salinarum]|uniref:SCO family protein n=1 Tax=Halobacillus salinarum TaxID=2932257 RepID=A0ABY4EKQ3_9BACI|nr:SCO family protein [Halobacillus salinarum]UOQ44448.1 SCO family protein [Halobacillus salinarum]